MSKRRNSYRRNTTYQTRSRRDVYAVTNPLLHRPLSNILRSSYRFERPVRPRLHVNRVRVVRARRVPHGTRRQLRAWQGTLSALSRPEFARHLPDAIVCARRKERREVLFARGRAGRGNRRRPEFKQQSYVRC